MILDALMKVCAAQQVTADAASASSVDLGNITPKRVVGSGEPMALLVVITAIGTNSGSAKVQAVQSTAAALTSPQILGEEDLATADIAAGKAFVVPLSSGVPALRYLGAYFDITGTVDFTVDAYIGPKSMMSVAALDYAKNYAV